jgi:hypothetical protein
LDEGDLFRGRAAPEPNVSLEAIKKVAESVGLPPDFRSDTHTDDAVSPLSFLFYLYGVVHSSEYRTKYAADLALDYPRVPLSPSSALYRDLLSAGADLVALHTLRPDFPYASWAKGPPAKSPFAVSTPCYSGGKVASIERGFPKFEAPRIYISPQCWFEGVDEATWESVIGGYQVCEKWLKARSPKRGEDSASLTKDEVTYYVQLLRVLKATSLVVARIDASIATSGGWPKAFSRGPIR